MTGIFSSVGQSIQWLRDDQGRITEIIDPEHANLVYAELLYFSFVSLTTLGYGDVVPVTPVGKVMGSVVGFIGVGMVALPAGIMASGFSSALQLRRNSLRREMASALEDGVLDAEDRTRIAAHAAALNLQGRHAQRLC